MRISHPLLTAGSASLLAFAATTATAQSFYGDPPDETHPWAVHDPNRPQPPLVKPGTFSTADKPGTPPSDAVILFDGTEATLANWIADKSPEEPTKWVVRDGTLQCVPGAGYVRTKAEWGDCQLHIEWSAPSKVEGSSQGRGNSGIFPMGQVEVQVLDNYDNPTYADGFAASVYGVNPPYANALRPPGDWQVYDIVFRRPVFKDGKELDPGRLTVMLNGVVVQDATPLEGGGGHKGRSRSHAWPEKGPLKLQDHGNPVRYRNIWYRPLPKRAVEGGTDGELTPEATKAKRAETAATLRADASKEKGKTRLLKLWESLVYAPDEAALKESDALFATIMAEVAAAGDKIESRKGDVMQLSNAASYLVKAKAVPEGWPHKAALEKVIKDNGWDQKK